MLKKILNLQNAEKLNKETQSKINGGIMIPCERNSHCPTDYLCSNGGFCYRVNY